MEGRIISSDNHVIEPPDLWTARIEAGYRDRAPRVVRDEDGNDWWWCEGIKGSTPSAGAQAGLRFEDPESLTLADKFENVRPGGYIPEEHVKDLDVDGIDVSILYPTVGLVLFGLVDDGQLLTALFKTYNDWLADFCKPYPRRLKGIAMLNVDDVDSSVKELERCAKMGLAGAMISVHPPEERSYKFPQYENLWAAAQDLDMPLSLHLGTNRPFPPPEHTTVAYMSNIDHWVRMSLTYIIFSGVFERYPKLNVGSVEMELSWVPHFLDRIDYSYTQRPQEFRAEINLTKGLLPSEYFHSNVFLSFQEDALGIKMRDLIGVDQLMWGSDYPHVESTFPRSHEILDEILIDCTKEERAKIAGGNAARLYHLD